MPEETTTTTGSQSRNSLGVPIAIIIAGLLIAGALYMNGGGKAPSTGVKIPSPEELAGQQPPAEVFIPPISKDDHVKGNPNAPIVIIEYSDYDCPFCRIFHDTMTKIMDEYGETGKVAWVYRHFPIAQLHPTASKISEAAYCVTDLGGNDAFWKFTDALNNSRKVEYNASGGIQSVEPTDMTRISEFATAAGVDKNKFETCYNSGKFTDKVKEDVVAATQAGAQGTPYSILIAGGQQGPINGAQPYEVVKKMIDTVIAQLDS